MIRLSLARRARSLFVVGALALGAGLAVMASTESASAQSTTRPEFIVGTALTAKADHTLHNTKIAIKKGAVGKVTKVRSSGGKIVQLDIAFGADKATSVPVDVVRKAYDYPH